MNKRLLKSMRNWLAIALMGTMCVIVGYGMSPPPADKNVYVAPTPAQKGPEPAPPSPPPTVPLNNYGFSANELVWMDAERRNQQLKDMKAVGVSRVRIDMQWYVVQPSNVHTYDWSVYDQAVDAIRQHGLHTLAILDYAPTWAAASGCNHNSRYKCAPADPQAFATFAAAAAARYTLWGVDSWEIWNEPNSPRFWYPKADAASYTAVLKAAYPAIKKINPNATVITGGLRSATSYGDVSPHGFVEALYAAGGGPYFDALAAHPYSYPALPSAASSKNGWTQMLKIRDVAVAHGDAHKQIWMTEVGATTGGPHPVRESVQAQIAHETVRLRSSYPWAGPLFWYDYKDLGSAWKSENFFGLVRGDGSLKPAYTAFVEAIKKYL